MNRFGVNRSLSLTPRPVFQKRELAQIMSDFSTYLNTLVIYLFKSNSSVLFE